jgi:DNA invertase Pin-like site-specific DNA recombinase
MTQAVAYSRCSGESQRDGDTWDRQEAAIKKYAAANGIEIVEWFRDEAVTGKMELEGRSGLSACIFAVREKKISMVVVEDSTRLARDLIVSEVVIREFQKIGVRVVAAAGGIDLTAGDDSNPTAKLVRQILAAVSEFERCCITLKLKGARERVKAKTGRCEGRKGFGLKPGENDTLATMRRLRTVESMTYSQIADHLNAAGIPSREGKEWRAGSVHRILSR